jgi:uncharacterized protein YdgA (DUF945 family)
MKRTGVVVTVVVAAAVVGWVGATWYTGGQIEAAARKAVADANAANWGATGELVSYERSLFSATSRYKVTMPRPQAEAITIFIDSQVNHGPLPLDRLARFQLKPVSATVESTLARNEGIGAQLKTAEANATVRARSVIDLDENVAFDLTTPALRMEQDGATTDVAAGTFTGTTRKADTHVKIDGRIASVRAATPAPNPLTIDVRDLTVNVDSRVGRFGMQVGDSAFRMGAFTLNGSTPDTGTALSVKGDTFGVAYHVAEDDKTLTGHISYNLGKLVLNNTDVGDFDLRLAARQLDGAATAKLAMAYQKMVVTNPPAGGPDAMRQAMTVLDAPIREVVAGKPVLALDSLIWTTPLGQSTLKIEAALAPRVASAAAGTPGSEPSVERASMDLSVSQPALVDTIARFTKTSPGGGPITLAQANEQAKMQLAMMVGGAAKEKLLVVKGDKIETHVTFDGRVVLINGQQPPPHLLAGLLGMVPFGQ